MDWGQVFSVLLGAGVGLVGSIVGTRQSERWRKRQQTLHRFHEELIPAATAELTAKSYGRKFVESATGSEIEQIREIYLQAIYLNPRDYGLCTRLYVTELQRSFTHNSILGDGFTSDDLQSRGVPEKYAKVCAEEKEFLSDLARMVRERLEARAWGSPLRRLRNQVKRSYKKSEVD